MYCPECGTQLPNDSVFCGNCGVKIEVPAEPAHRKPQKGKKKSPKKSRKKSPSMRSIVLLAAAVILTGILIVFFVKAQGTGENVGRTDRQSESFSAEDSASGETESLPTVSAQTDPAIPYETAKKAVTGTSIENTAEKAVSSLSTADYAKATDFEWFLDCELSSGFEAGLVITNPGAVNGIQGNEAALLNGGWKAFLSDTLTKPYNPYIERYFNVNIDTDGNRFDAAMNWKYMYFPERGQSQEEEGSDMFRGTWDPAASTATCESDYGRIVFDHFFIAPDLSAEYATGTFYWISGETERIALKRTAP